MVSLEFFFDIILWPWGRPASYRNEYQKYFLACKNGRCLGLTTAPLSCTDFLKFGNLNLLELSEPVQLYFYLDRAVCFFSGIWLSKQLAVRVLLLSFRIEKVIFRKERRRRRRICRLLTSVESHKLNPAV